ncbi:signal peptidase II [Candidatus Falkowbacteria bacterium]|nr:signal peptidase II [Candidatus Falkowbacteria bacterium]
MNLTFAKKMMLINFLISILFLADRLAKWCALGISEGGVFLFSEKFVGLRFYKNFNLIFNIALPEILMYGLISIILAVLAWLLIKNYRQKNIFLIFSFSLIIAGAVSNLIDRLYFGFVIDFISFFDYSVFNLSDVYIIGGVGLIFIREFFLKNKNL